MSLQSTKSLHVSGRLLLAAYTALSIPLITWMVYLNPSGSPPGNPFSNWIQPTVWSATLFTFSFLLFAILLILERVIILRMVQIVTGTVLCGTAILMAQYIHRDYYSAVFMILVSLGATNLYRIPDLPLPPKGRKYLHQYSLVALFICFALMIWILLMGYAIAVRSEPRWSESILYNTYNGGLLLITFVSSLRLGRGGKRNVVVGRHTLIIDDLDLSMLLNEKTESILFLLFKYPGERITCRFITDEEPEYYREECEWCTVAGSCTEYGKLESILLELKKIITSLQLGSLELPDPKRRSRSEGWIFRPSSDVTIELVPRDLPTQGS